MAYVSKFRNLINWELEEVIECYRALFIAPIGSRSHKIFYDAIITELINKQHQVTVITPYRYPKPVPNVTEILTPDGNIGALMPNMFEEGTLGMFRLFSEMILLCSKLLVQPEIQEIIKQKFDVVLLSIFFSDCFLSIVHEMQIPFIAVTPASPHSPILRIFGNPEFPSFAGNMAAFPHKTPLSFLERVKGVIFENFMWLNYRLLVIPKFEQYCKELGGCSETMPSLAKLVLNSSLLFTNKYRKTLVNVFAKLPQRVIWKWGAESMEDLPKNVMLSKWLPQQDLLGHPNVKLFISHGGLLSTLEAIYHSAPILIMPVFADQFYNGDAAVKHGIGKAMQWTDISEEDLFKIIEDIIEDQNIKENISKLSNLMKDQVAIPAEIAAYWVEYVVRHQGARHLRPSMTDIAWYELYNVDVWLTIIIGLLSAVFISLKIFAKFCKFIINKRKLKND